MDTAKLDELMRRASKIDAAERAKLKQQAQRVRENCAEARQRLKEAEAKMIELTPKAEHVKAYVSNFRWDRVRKGGMPTDVRDHLRELNLSMQGGLHSIREAICKIDDFREEDLAGKWRPSNNVSAIVATATHAEQMLGVLERELEFWERKLEQGFSAIAASYEAIEGKPPASNEPSRTITNVGLND
jgi:chromosome segregation ATPase